MHTIGVNQEVDALLKSHIESRANERAERSREQPVIARSGGPSKTEDSDHKESDTNEAKSEKPVLRKRAKKSTATKI